MIFALVDLWLWFFALNLREALFEKHSDKEMGLVTCLNDPILLILFLFAWHTVYGPKPSFVFGQYPSVAFAGVNCNHHFASNCKKLGVVIQPIILPH